MKVGRKEQPEMAMLSDGAFIKAYTTEGPRAMGVRLGITSGSIRCRADRLRKKGVNVPLMAEGKNGKVFANTNIIASLGGAALHDVRLPLKVPAGQVIVFSDAHYWPGPPSTMHRALLHMIKELQPVAVICNGDAVDLAAISRHPPIGWEKQPTVQEEIEASQDRLHEVIDAYPRARHIWNLGNHDARFETKLATVAPEFAKVVGIHLYDHFPLWDRAWSTWINDDVVIKHRWKGGIHATHNNTLGSGKSMVTGHLHSAKVTPYTDYNGTRFGVDTGCLAEPFGQQFVNYTEDNARNWISGFGVLTFHNNKLLWPELVTKWDDNTIQFRGKLISV